MKKIEKINNNNNENTNKLLCGLKREGEGRRGGECEKGVEKGIE